jgi:hypothetical protein
MPRVSISPLPPGSAFARFIKSLPFGPEFASAQFPDTPAVASAISARRVQKANVPGLSATNTPDLMALGVFDNATALLLAGESAFEAARSRMREVLFGVPVPREVESGTGGGWIVDGRALPVVRGGLFDTLQLNPAYLGSIFVLTTELARRRGSEVIVRNAALGAAGRTESRLFLDPSSAATADTPGSITAGVTPTPWTGVPELDFPALIARITTSGKGAAFFLRPTDLAAILAGSHLQSDGRTLFGLPVILAPNGPVGQITLADLSEVCYAATTVEVDVSSEATLEMEDAPVNAVAEGSPSEPTPAQMVNLFQASASGFKISRYANWSVPEGAVAFTSMAGSPA